MKEEQEEQVLDVELTFEEEVTAEPRLVDWKTKYGSIYKFEVEKEDDILVFFFRKPDMKTMRAVGSVASKDPLQSAQVFFKSCLLNQEMIKYCEEVDVFLSLEPQLQDILETYNTKVKKL